MALSSEQQYYAFAFSSHAYVQCNGELLYFQPCNSGLYWNQESKSCDREQIFTPRLDLDQPESYQTNYNTESYSRPSVPSIERSVDRQSGYRYRNYNSIAPSERSK